MALTMTRPRRTVEFCTNLSLKAEHERAEVTLREAEKAAANDRRETGSSAARDAAERVQSLETQMREHTVVFTLEGMPRKRWAEFEAAHPPRKGDATDAAFEIDISALDEAIAPSIVAVESLDGAAVEFDPAKEWGPLADEMTSGQWQDFALALLNVNRGVKAVPFSAAASQQIRKSEPSSN